MMTKNNESLSDRFYLFKWVFFLLIISSFLFGCNFPTSKNSIQQNRSQGLSDYSTAYVDVQFNLLIPEKLSENEKINLVIFDEVTGLPYNRRTYLMKEEDPNRYSVSLSIPMLSVIKYRYEKFDSTTTPEVDSTGEIVRYRMYYVNNNNNTTDLLFSWSINKVSNHEFGRFEGVIIDRESGVPIPDIMVSLGGQRSISDANGIFSFEQVNEGIHNVLFYAIDGKYQSFQQSATIVDGRVTPAEVELNPNKEIEVTLNVTQPDEALGAPVYIAGNLLQFGNTFTDLQGQMSIDPNQLPELTPIEDGKLSIKINLYSGTDFRFKFTLGDGYWNAEHDTERGFLTRQLIVPENDITLKLNIESWRAPVFEPISFETFVHPGIGHLGERYIQFKADTWTEPIPMWPLGNGDYLYILFSPFEINNPITYRVCLTKVCDSENNSPWISPTEQVEPTDKPINQSIDVTLWSSEKAQDGNNINIVPIPYKSDTYKTSIELNPDIYPLWSSLIPVGLEEIKQNMVQNVIFTPQWFYKNENQNIQPVVGTTPFMSDLVNDIKTAQDLDLGTGLFPQIGPLNDTEERNYLLDKNDLHAEDWFKLYQRFIINYAKIAEISKADQLILGGKSVIPAIDLEKNWLSLINEIRSIYHGELVWAVNAGIEVDPLPSFIGSFDEIYINMDSTLSSGTDATFDQIAAGFTYSIDSLIYEVYRSTFKPITLALAYPSVNGASQGCKLINENCINDGLFLQEELSNKNIDLQEQTDIYNAILPITASREWITGISIRGYIPAGNSDDPSSSIAGKPVMEVIEYWYSGITN